jgi:hypothetical protein
MDPATIKGLVYLVLILAGGAGIWILVLYLILGAARRRNAELELANAALAAQLSGVRARVEARSKPDAELLDDVTSLLADL